MNDFVKKDGGKVRFDLIDAAWWRSRWEAAHALSADVVCGSYENECEKAVEQLGEYWSDGSMATLRAATDAVFAAHTALAKGLAVSPLMHSDFIEEQLARVLTFGAAKYAAQNWRQIDKHSRYWAAAKRHLQLGALSGRPFDDETGLLHISHALCSLMFLEVAVERGYGEDDRWREPDPAHRVSGRLPPKHVDVEVRGGEPIPHSDLVPEEPAGPMAQGDGDPGSPEYKDGLSRRWDRIREIERSFGCKIDTSLGVDGIMRAEAWPEPGDMSRLMCALTEAFDDIQFTTSTSQSLRFEIRNFAIDLGTIAL